MIKGHRLIGRLFIPLIAGAVVVGGVWSATAVGSSTDGRGTFLDDDGSVHEADINALAAAAITQGCNPPDNTEYCPTRPVSRAEMATFLVRALELPPGEPVFTDTGSSIHSADIAALAQAGITKGCNPPADTAYCPTQAVSRQEMASFLVRALGLAPADSSPFTDTEASIHSSDIAALAQAGITKGCNPPANTLFCPTQAVSRQEMAGFLVRALDLDPIRNRLSLRHGLTCAKDGESCTARVTLGQGIMLEVVEGWYQVLPYLDGEEATFSDPATAVAFAWNGAELPSLDLGIHQATGSATRLWRVRPPPLTPGTHLLDGVWRWDGTVTQEVTYLITVP